MHKIPSFTPQVLHFRLVYNSPDKSSRSSSFCPSQLEIELDIIFGLKVKLDKRTKGEVYELNWVLSRYEGERGV